LQQVTAPAQIPKEDFLRGWDLLLAQPWGRRYATVQDKATAATAATQLAFYYRKLGTCQTVSWLAACDLFAQGDHWPSVEELRSAAYAHTPKPFQLTSALEQGISPVLSLSFAYAKAQRVTTLEALQVILPQWCQENPTHEDWAMAQEMLEKVKGQTACEGGINSFEALQ